jgi:hypothetical protein
MERTTADRSYGPDLISGNFFLKGHDLKDHDLKDFVVQRVLTVSPRTLLKI